jgi:hypothetical protein
VLVAVWSSRAEAVAVVDFGRFRSAIRWQLQASIALAERVELQVASCCTSPYAVIAAVAGARTAAIALLAVFALAVRASTTTRDERPASRCCAQLWCGHRSGWLPRLEHAADIPVWATNHHATACSRVTVMP